MHDAAAILDAYEVVAIDTPYLLATTLGDIKPATLLYIFLHATPRNEFSSLNFHGRIT